MGLHSKHRIVKIDDEKALQKENLTINKSTKDFDYSMEQLNKLKDVIEQEMEKIDKALEKADNDTTNAFAAKRAKLDKEEEELKDKLKNEVTKTKERLEEYMTLVNNLIKNCEKIKKGIQALEKVEKNMILNVSYISRINMNQKEVDTVINLSMKNLDIYFNENESIIEYGEYYFNGKFSKFEKKEVL